MRAYSKAFSRRVYRSAVLTRNSYKKKRSEDYRSRSMTVDAPEHIRRFLLHVLPSGFTRIRYFGFLSNTSKKHSIPLIRQSLGQSPDLPEKVELSVKEMMLNLTGIDITRCPRCKTGTMVIIGRSR